MKSVRYRGVSALGGLLAALGVIVAGCGAPAYTYVANTKQNAYFKVPHEWTSINSAAMAKALGASAGSGMWTEGFDASARPSAQHVLPAVPTSKPFVYATAGQLPSSTSEVMSYDLLRNYFLPVTSNDRQAAGQEGFSLTGFRLLASTTITASQGIHGIREIYEYTFPGGHVVVFDQEALTNANANSVYVLFVHCTQTCYLHNQSAINTVMQSFTVRSP